MRVITAIFIKARGYGFCKRAYYQGKLYDHEMPRPLRPNLQRELRAKSPVLKLLLVVKGPVVEPLVKLAQTHMCRRIGRVTAET